jgi:hypothetical protein
VSADLKIDDRAFRSALKRFEANSRRSSVEVLKEQAKLFVQDAILITPPNKDFRANRRGGEAAVKADLRKIMRQSASAKASSDPAGIHTKFRDPATGRVRVALKKKIRVTNLASYIQKELAKVGILASGWNAAAMQLGAKVPDWVARHGKGRGSIKLTFTLTECRIVIANGVKFAPGVRGLVSRIQRSLDKRATAMNRQVDHFQKQAAREAGFR